MRNDRYFCTWPECGRSYAKPSKLTEHYRSHTNDVNTEKQTNQYKYFINTAHYIIFLEMLRV